MFIPAFRAADTYQLKYTFAVRKTTEASGSHWLNDYHRDGNKQLVQLSKTLCIRGRRLPEQRGSR